LKTRAIITILSILTFVSTTFSQDADFSQFYNNPIYINPAHVGLYSGLKVRFNYQRQWTKIPAKFNSYCFSADIGERSLPGAGGIGIIASSSRSTIGITRNTMVGIFPAVRINVAENMILQTGFLAAFVQKRIDWDGLIFPDQLHPVYGDQYPTSFVAPDDDRISYPDFSAGLIFQFRGANNLIGNIGGAIHHLTRPNESWIGKTAPLYRRVVAHYDMIIDFSGEKSYYGKVRDFKINPGVYFQNQSNLNDYMIGLNVYFTKLYVGVWYRNESLEYDVYSHFSLMGGVNIPIIDNESRIKFMYSYDMIINGEHMFSGPTHEISIILEFDQISFFGGSVGASRSGGVLGGYSRSGARRLDCSPF
jgi:type IX secretion system PorP/SprF family membrane protein